MGDGPYSEEDWSRALSAAEDEQVYNDALRPCPMFNGYLSTMKRGQRERGIDIEAMNQVEYAEHMRAMALGLMTEAAEVVESFQWKPWKHSHDEGFPIDKDDTLDEVCDLLHFLGHLCDLAGITDDDLNRGMERCISKNTGRVRNGYSY